MLMRISEPATMLTDYALALLSAFFAFSISLRSSARKPWIWIAAFSLIGIAALTGGTAHGFRGPLGDNWGLVWKITVSCIALGSALLIVAGIRSAVHPETSDRDARRLGHRWLKRAVAVSLPALAVLVLKLSPHPHFNHNDVYHVIQMGGLYCLYRAAILLGGCGYSNHAQKAEQ